MRDVQVLCVDDEQSLLDLTETFLARESDRISVVTATTADDALDVLAAEDVDCIVSDYDLEHRTGLAFLKTVREDHPHVPFVLFTGKGSEAVAADAVSAGVTDYLQKGGREQYALLANRVENAVDAARAERELERTREKTTQLHEHAAEIAGSSSRDAVVDAALSAADDILEFHVYGLYEARDDHFEPLGEASYEPDSLPGLDEGVLGKTYRRGESFRVDDVAGADDAAPDRSSFRSAVSVPVGDDVVFQAIAADPDAFTESDLELTELLATHVEQAFERIDREREYERTTEQLQAILENTTAIVYIKDREGRYELANERFREVVDVDGDLVGRTDWEIQDDEFAAEVRANDRRAIEEERAIEVEEDAYRDGERRTYYSVKVPLFDDDGDPTGVCGISSDITELKEREHELERERNRLDEFASVVAHDLRGPLSVAEGYRELLADDVGDDERLAEIEAAHERMAELIDDVLSLAREGDTGVETRAVSIADVVESARSAVELPEAVTVDVDGDGVVEADASRLRRVFENLFRNAVDHGNSTSRIRVEVTDDGFAVSDDGDGLPADAREDLFEYGVTAGDGTGIGLAVVREIVQAHDWSVRCTESDAGGARFEVATAESPNPAASTLER